MNRKFLSVLTFALLILNTAGLALADTRPKKPTAKRQVNPLIAKLPASDAVALIDARRFFDQALPQILASKQDLLEQIIAGISDFQGKTGIDVRRFDRIAIGVNLLKRNAKDTDVEFVVLGQGSMNMGRLIAAAKLGTNAGYREETVGGRTIYIFSTKSVADKNLPATPAPDAVNKVINGAPAEMAVTTLDTNIIVVGSPARVRQTLEGKSSVAPEITSQLPQRANPIFAFAGRMPQGAMSFLPMDNDELAKNIESIKFVSGWGDVTAAGASMNVTARTTNAERAQNLYETVAFLQGLGKGLLGNSKKPENAVFARLVENARVAKVGADVTLDLTVAQSDIDLLLATLVKK